ncbi:MAG: hypothetical protein OSB09_11260, partial [Planctomycetota bacterium]|nr:hypothetical protein [Planctomycetota bacterium]
MISALLPSLFLLTLTAAPSMADLSMVRPEIKIAFAPPVRLEANGKPIDVTIGHAAPYIIDFDGD